MDIHGKEDDSMFSRSIEYMGGVLWEVLRSPNGGCHSPASGALRGRKSSPPLQY